MFEEPELVKCPICKNKIELKDDWWDWIPEGCHVRPVIPPEFETPPIICEESLETHPECIFAALWGRFLLERDKEFDGYLMGPNDTMESVEFERSSEAEGTRGTVRGPDGQLMRVPGVRFMEYQVICYICKGVLGCNRWVEVPCGHCFHVQCIAVEMHTADHTREEEEESPIGRECPVCLFTIPLDDSRMPAGLLWATYKAPHFTTFPFIMTRGRFKMDEGVLWWVLDQMYLRGTGGTPTCKFSF